MSLFFFLVGAELSLNTLQTKNKPAFLFQIQVTPKGRVSAYLLEYIESELYVATKLYMMDKPGIIHLFKEKTIQLRVQCMSKNFKHFLMFFYTE